MAETLPGEDRGEDTPPTGLLPDASSSSASTGVSSGSADGGIARARDGIVEGRSRDLTFPQWILNAGFMAALMLAGASLVIGACYLFFFLWKTSTSVATLIARSQEVQISSSDLKIAISSQLHIAKIALLSCSILVGMAFGFLGFSLFLIGVRAELDVNAGKEGTQIKIARMSPGVFVILCATVMISVSATHQTPFSMGAGPETGDSGVAQASDSMKAAARPTAPTSAPSSEPVEKQVGNEFLNSLKASTKNARPDRQ
jgi:hypothetical protein